MLQGIWGRDMSAACSGVSTQCWTAGDTAHLDGVICRSFLEAAEGVLGHVRQGGAVVGEVGGDVAAPDVHGLGTAWVHACLA